MQTKKLTRYAWSFQPKWLILDSKFPLCWKSWSSSHQPPNHSGVVHEPLAIHNHSCVWQSLLTIMSPFWTGPVARYSSEQKNTTLFSTCQTHPCNPQRFFSRNSLKHLGAGLGWRDQGMRLSGVFSFWELLFKLSPFPNSMDVLHRHRQYRA